MSKDKIYNAIRTLVGADINDKVFTFDAEVTGSVNAERRTVNVTMVGGTSSNEIEVRIMSSVDDGCLFYPKEGSTVTVLMSDRTDPLIVGYSEIERIKWLGGEYEGVPIVKHPTDSNKGLVKRLNLVENKLRDLQQILSSPTWTVIPNDGGAALQVAAATWCATPLTITAQSDIEHPNHSH